MGEVSSSSVAEGPLQGSAQGVLMKQSMVLKELFIGCSWWRMDAYCTVPTSQARPEIHTFCRKGCWEGKVIG